MVEQIRPTDISSIGTYECIVTWQTFGFAFYKFENVTYQEAIVKARRKVNIENELPENTIFTFKLKRI